MHQYLYPGDQMPPQYVRVEITVDGKIHQIVSFPVYSRQDGERFVVGSRNPANSPHYQGTGSTLDAAITALVVNRLQDIQAPVPQPEGPHCDD